MANYSTDKSPQYIRTYECWNNLRQRCENPQNPQFPDYGGRGITVSARWKQFSQFLADMGLRPEGLTLERVNNDLGYFPENCIWATRQVQAENRRTRKDNKSGVKGISLEIGRKLWRAEGNRKTLYYGRDFFEACCARKSWEAAHV